MPNLLIVITDSDVPDVLLWKGSLEELTDKLASYLVLSGKKAVMFGFTPAEEQKYEGLIGALQLEVLAKATPSGPIDNLTNALHYMIRRMAPEEARLSADRVRKTIGLAEEDAQAWERSKKNTESLPTGS